MPDDPSLGELGRTLVRIEALQASDVRRLEREHAADIQRVERESEANLRRLEREHENDIAQVREELKELRERPALSMGRMAAIALAVASLLALVFQAYGTLKGAK